jgi:hypothetical protein
MDVCVVVFCGAGIKDGQCDFASAPAAYTVSLPSRLGLVVSRLVLHFQLLSKTDLAENSARLERSCYAAHTTSGDSGRAQECMCCACACDDCSLVWTTHRSEATESGFGDAECVQCNDVLIDV